MSLYLFPIRPLAFLTIGSALLLAQEQQPPAPATPATTPTPAPTPAPSAESRDSEPRSGLVYRFVLLVDAGESTAARRGSSHGLRDRGSYRAERKRAWY